MSNTNTAASTNGRRADGTADTTVRTEQEIVKEMVLAALGELGGRLVSDDSLTFEGNRFVLPTHLNGNIGAAVRYLEDYDKQQNAMTEFNRTYKYRPFDGAHAFNLAMQKVFGTSGIGVATPTFFGPEPPQLRSIPTSHNTSTQVPWGRVEFSPLTATFQLGAQRTQEDGLLFRIQVLCPRRYRKHIEGFLDVVQEQLEKNSIYRGKAMDAAELPNFIDTTLVDPKTVVYNKDVFTQLHANFWSLLDYSDEMRKQGIPLKRAVLVEGQYGTGKTLCGALTAQRAVANGWTFINVKPGDNLYEALNTAQLYSPAVVWFEDVDVLSTGAENRADVSQLLDALDGIQSKGVEVMAGFTTNFPDKIEKGVLRPGRIDSVIHIGELDPEGFERLVKVVISEANRGEIDFAPVAEAMKGFLPAFVREASERAIRYSMARNRGVPTKINTADLVAAADSMRAQLKLMEDATEASARDTLDAGFKKVIENSVKEQLNQTAVVDDDGDTVHLFFDVGNETAMQLAERRN